MIFVQAQIGGPSRGELGYPTSLQRVGYPFDRQNTVFDRIPPGSRQEKRFIYGQADRNGGGAGESGPCALTISKCKNVVPFFIEICFFDIQNPILSQGEGSQKFVIILMRLLHCYLAIL